MDKTVRKLRKEYFDLMDRIYLNEEAMKKQSKNNPALIEQLKKDYTRKEELESFLESPLYQEEAKKEEWR